MPASQDARTTTGAKGLIFNAHLCALARENIPAIRFDDIKYSRVTLSTTQQTNISTEKVKIRVDQKKKIFFFDFIDYPTDIQTNISTEKVKIRVDQKKKNFFFSTLSTTQQTNKPAGDNGPILPPFYSTKARTENFLSPENFLSGKKFFCLKIAQKDL